MKSFREFVEERKVKKARPDRIRAKSMFTQAINRINDLKTLPINETNAPFRFEDAYESVREALQAFMYLEGFNPYSHEAILVFGFERGFLTEAEFRTWDRNREIRNDIHYRSEKTTLEATEKAIRQASELIGKFENVSAVHFS